MNGRTRRAFLEDVGRGMLAASLGSAVSLELGIAPCFGDEPSQRLTFGRLEPLVSLLQETPPDTLLPLVVDKLKSGTPLRHWSLPPRWRMPERLAARITPAITRSWLCCRPIEWPASCPLLGSRCPSSRCCIATAVAFRSRMPPARRLASSRGDRIHAETAQGDEALRDAVRAVDLDRAESHLRDDLKTLAKRRLQSIATRGSG